MPASTRQLNTRDGYQQVDFKTLGDIQDRFPLGNYQAMQDFFRTIRACRKGATESQSLVSNDLMFAWRNLFDRTRLRPGSTVDPGLLTVMDGTRWGASLSGTGETVDGVYQTASAAAGTLAPVGAGFRPTANPTINHFATAAAFADNVACVSMWLYNPADTGAIFGSLVRGAAATDHVRAEVRQTDGNFALVSRVASSDGDDATAAAGTDLTGLPANGSSLKYISIGVSVTAADLVKGFQNGVLMASDSTPGGAALTGNAVGVRFGGTASIMTPILIAMVAFAI